MDESINTTEEPKQRSIRLKNNNTFAATPLSLLPRPHPHQQYPKSDNNLITNVKIEKIEVENEMSTRTLLPLPAPSANATPPRSMLPHPLDQSSSPFKPYDAGKKLLSRSDINLPLRIQPHPSAFFPPPPNPLTHPFTPFAPHLPLHHLHIASKASKLEVGVGVTNNCWQPTIGSSLQR